MLFFSHFFLEIFKLKWSFNNKIQNSCVAKKTFVFKETMNIHKDARHSDPTITKPTVSPNKNKLIKLKVKSKKLLRLYPSCSATHKSLENHLKIRNLEIDVKKKEICPECGKIVNKLVDHQKRAHTGTVFQCQKCPHTTKDFYELTRHFKKSSYRILPTDLPVLWQGLQTDKKTTSINNVWERCRQQKDAAMPNVRNKVFRQSVSTKTYKEHPL